MRTFPLLALAATLAGCAAPGAGGHPALGTGLVQPGAEAALAFELAGTFALHCDPHPFMEHDVTVAEGAPTIAHVHILDGNATSEYRFDPQELRVGPGAVVTYHNHGALAHTASERTEGMQH